MIRRDPRAREGELPAHRGILVAGDMVAFLVFGALGRASHGVAASLWGTVEAALPFALAWLVVGAGLHAFDPARLARPADAVKRTALTWLAAWPVGLLLRALLLQREVPWSFALVVLGTNLVILGLWRAGYAWTASRTGRAA
ncbi:DUF3054 domain-containing protein [Limnochorda pilosa]|uniref:DUF3054 domain-containing protein n=1 Tax=Limnochorda pilosa TaxID=1555112 RepID=A0A0K2SJG4_LIMPI|nr:DUF3054 domain-containing protein [Limnochorda pilosa]BAS27230.1 hypothetical protein LIP_1379 [Limnochorda pilosa]